MEKMNENDYDLKKFERENALSQAKRDKDMFDQMVNRYKNNKYSASVK